MPFTHLHTYSNHSHLRAVLHPEELPILAKQAGMKAIALTDQNTIAGAVRFYKACKKENVKAIIGTTLTDTKHNDRQTVLLAKNQKGYANICKLITLRQLNTNFNLIQALLETDLQNIVILTQSAVVLERLTPISSNLYICLHNHCPQTRLETTQSLKLAAKYKLPVVAAPPIRFEKSSDYKLYKILRAIDQNITLSDLTTSDLDSITEHHHFKSNQEMQNLFTELPEALSATNTIAAQCNFEFELGKYTFPAFDKISETKPQSTPASPTTDYWPQTTTRLLTKLCIQGLRQRVPNRTAAYLKRLRYELKVIHQLGFTDYFLVVWDIAQYAKREHIPCIGRGSAANSLVAFCLELTHVDPIQMNLYFERFLNPSRKSPPDIDLDFSWKHRMQVLRYAFERYGETHVAMICTTITLGLRSAFREVAKTFGLDDREISKITKRFPYFTRLVESISALKKEHPSCRQLPLEDEPYCTIFLFAQRLAAFPRHLSVHPGGIIICREPLYHYTAQQRSANQLIVTQYDMYSIEDLGLVKIDLLGNRSLGVYKDCIDTFHQRGQNIPNLENHHIAQNDPATKQLIQTGNTIGCFYIESPAMRALLQKLGTDNFESLTAASSVIRPGVAESGMMDAYIERVRDHQKAKYLHQKIKDLLADTHGVMIYQEDVLKIAHHLANMSLADADLFRRAMSGKARSKDAMQKLTTQFISGCIQNGVPQKTAKEIWRQVESFAGYSFCKAHSASFAQLSFKVAYLKCHFPAEFMAAVINNGGGFYGTAAYISECKRMGITVLPPCINHSSYDYNGQGQTIRMGLIQIGELSHKTKYRILHHRLIKPYANLSDLFERAQISKHDAEILILCGACDCLGPTRPQLMYELAIHPSIKKPVPQTPQLTLSPITDQRRAHPCLGESGLPALLDDYSITEKCQYELTYFGFLISHHPLEFISQEQISRLQSPSYRLITSQQLATSVNQSIRILGWCITAKTIRTKKTKSYMKFMSMEDLSGTFEVTLFPAIYNNFAAQTYSHGPYLVIGTVGTHFGIQSITAKSIYCLTA